MDDITFHGKFEAGPLFDGIVFEVSGSSRWNASKEPQNNKYKLVRDHRPQALHECKSITDIKTVKAPLHNTFLTGS